MYYYYKVLFWIPNIVDYCRLVCLVLFVKNDAEENFERAALWYLASTVLDEFDGRLARFFDQCSSFGSQLDYAIDYLSTILIFMSFYSKVDDPVVRGYLVSFIGLEALVHQFWTAVTSRTNTITHTGPANGQFMFSLLRAYYTNKNLFRVMVFYDSTVIPLALYAHTNFMYDLSFRQLTLIILPGTLRRVVQAQKLIQATTNLLLESGHNVVN